MVIPAENWKNKNGTSNRKCKCATWKQHWLNTSGEYWPEKCSIHGCNNSPTLGAHIIHPDVSGEKIVPACASCNQLSGEFELKERITIVSANKAKTCER